MAENNFENNIENLLNHIADDNRISGEEFAEAVNKLETLIKENKSYNEEMIKSLREAIKLLSESKKYIGAFKAGSGKGEELDKDTAIYALNEFLKDLKESNPELFKEKKSGGEPFSNTDIGSQLQKWFGPRNGNADREQKQMFQNLFNLTKRPNSDDDKDNKKTNKFLDGIKGFFSSRSFLGKLGATILGAIMDSKFLKGGLKDLIMFGVLLVSSWIRKHFGPVAGAITFFAPAILGVLGKILVSIASFRLFKGLGGLLGGAVGLLGGRKVAGMAAKGATRILGKEGAELSIKETAKILGGAAKNAGAGKGVTKAIGQEAAKLIASQGTKTVATKAGSKALGTAAKVLGKKIPGVGAIIGTGLAAGRLMQGDFLGAGMEFASGLASTVPGVGTAASLALDAGLIAKDMGAFKGAGNISASTVKTGTKTSTSKWGWAIGALIPLLFPLTVAMKRFSNSINQQSQGYTGATPKGIIGKIDITNNLLMNILNVLKRKSNYNSFGFSDVQTDMEGNPIGLIDKFKSWVSTTFSSGSTGGTPSGHSNTYVNEGSFGGHGISSAYGAHEAFRNHDHGGLDLRYNKGDAVGAKVAGIVKYSGNHVGSGGKGSYGGLVVITDEKGRDHYYGHLLSRLVKKGQQVSQGTIIGLAGSTGDSTGNHLHYEVRENVGKGVFTGNTVDPIKAARDAGYDEAAEKKVFQAEEDYNTQYKPKSKSKANNVSQKAHIAFKKIAIESPAKINVEGVTIIGK